MRNRKIKEELLIVDDEPQNLETLFQALKSENYKIIAAPNGKIALDLLQKHQPSAIIMDWDMPEMNGIEAIKSIRKKPKTHNIPIIIATGKMMTTENLVTSLESGANDYIRKPFDNVEIIARVRSMIRLNNELKKNLQLQAKSFQQEKKYLNERLTINKQILTTEKLKLIKHLEETTDIINKLSLLKSHTTEDGYKIVKDIISSIKTNESQMNWMELEALFTDIHPSFFKKLQRLYPELTLNERRLCALIKLNLSSKEIASIFNRQIESIKKAKYRLRNKINISAESSLYAHIQEI